MKAIGSDPVSASPQPEVISRNLDLGKVDYNNSGRRNCAVTLMVALKYSKEEHRLDIDLQPCRDRVAEFSLTGAIWNPRQTDAYSCGQNVEEVAALFPENKLVQRLADIWRRWHLNGMRPGTRSQMEFLRNHRDGHGRILGYMEAVQALEVAGLHPDKGYRYGAAWLAEKLPADIESEVRSLIVG